MKYRIGIVYVIVDSANRTYLASLDKEKAEKEAREIEEQTGLKTWVKRMMLI